MNVETGNVECLSEPGLPQAPFNCKACPDYDCVLNTSNGLFNLKINLQGPWSSPPFLARLYCRNGKLGRFSINLTKVSTQELVSIHGVVVARYGDVFEWSNNGHRNMGLIDDTGNLLSLEMYYSCQKFSISLIEYLKSRKIEYIKAYISSI